MHGQITLYINLNVLFQNIIIRNLHAFITKKLNLYFIKKLSINFNV